MDLERAVVVVRDLLDPKKDSFAEEATAEVREALEALASYAAGSCVHVGCVEVAARRIYWPGRPPARMCARHADAAATVAGVMGFPLHVETIL